MHKWNMFKRTAPIALSLVVAATSMPGTVLAADAFEDGTVVEAAADVTETPETEEAAEEAETEETEEAEVITDAEEETSEEELSVFDSGEGEVFADSESAETDAFSAESASEYTYLYAALTWSEYWANESVYDAGDATAATEKDNRSGVDEYDTGAFDAVTRATFTHGPARASYQCDVVYNDANGNSYHTAYFNEDGTTLTLTDGTTIAYDKNTLTSYTYLGLKYVPVAVKTADLDAFKTRYTVVENGGVLQGGTNAEGKIPFYSVIADVDANTVGLKTATKNADGSFSFSARKSTGTNSGIKDSALKTRTQSDFTVTVQDSSAKQYGSFGEFIRVNLTGDNYGDLGANMQAVRWDYYENGSTVLRSFGTKFAADNWMHSKQGVQLGLTNSVRCQLPAGTDGTGKWVITIYALGYADIKIEVNATSDNIVAANLLATNAKLTEAKALVTKAEALKESDYTAASWSSLQTKLGEMKTLLAGETVSAPALNDQISALTAALNGLVKPAPTATPTPASSVKVSKTVINLNLKKSTTLKPVVTGSGELTYTSSNKKVATVSSKGKITAKKTGKAVITVKYGTSKTKVTVYVNEKLSLKKTSATIKVKGKTTIKATTNIKGTITYTSSNKKVATVTSKGVVKGVKKGTATITVKCNGKTQKFKVRVK